MLKSKEIRTCKVSHVYFPVQFMVIWKVNLTLLIRKYRSLKSSKNTEVSLYLVDDELFAPS